MKTGTDSTALAPPRYDIQEARTRIKRVFRYLLELHRVKTPPTVHLGAYDWRLDLATLPRHEAIERGAQWRSAGAAEDKHHLLNVGRPKETECPQPSVVVRNWLRSGWDRVGTEPSVFKTRKIRTDSEESISACFEDSEARVEAFDEWLARRAEWEESERGVVLCLELFNDLFELSGRFARESEKYQLYLADGILVMDHEGTKVKHPVLLQRVQLDFNALAPEFTIRESTEYPELYSPLLRYLGVDPKEMVHAKETLAAHRYHPLDRDATTGFLKDLVHRFWPDGEFFEHRNLVGNAAGPYLYRQPFLMLGHRNHGFAETIERYVETLDEAEELPESLLRVVGIDTGRGADDEAEEGTPIDLLLTKDANPEQERVLRRLEQMGAVLVQGPPGTGKSHTIANLIGHLLAQDKTILVTSHASKALRVVREKVVEPLQALCVSLLDSDDESTKQLEESITGIVNYLSATTQKKLERATAKLAEKREALRRQHDELRWTLVEATGDEYRPLEILGERKSPADMAHALREGKSSHDWIPGPVGPGTGLPLPAKEITELYRLNGQLSPEDEKILGASLPDPAELPDPKEFAALFDEIARLETLNLKVGAEFWRHDEQANETLADLAAAIKAAARVFDVEEPWIPDCIEAGRKGKDEKDAWLGLVRIVETAVEIIPTREKLILEYGPAVDSTEPDKALTKVCDEIIEHLAAGRPLDESAPAEWRELIAAATVDGGAPSLVVHFEALRHLLEVRSLRDDLKRRWDRQMEAFEAPRAAELGRKPEKRANQYLGRIRPALAWHDDAWAKCLEAFDQAGLDWDRLLQSTPAQTHEYGHVLVLKQLLREGLAPLLETRKQYLHLQDLKRRRERWLKYLRGFSRKAASYPIVKLLVHGLKKKDFDSYAHAWRRLAELLKLVPVRDRRWELLQKLEEGAAAWAHMIHERLAPHDRGEVPGDIADAWRYRHWQQHVDALHEHDLDALQAKLSTVKAQLHAATASYVEKLAWAAQLGRTGLKQQQALNGWLALHKKMGRGTGKRVGRLKEEAKKTLMECRQAVPVWIMPLSRVIESFDLATTRFDVVILDEASQNDVMGLVALAMGREAVVVGDHEQVSPYAVGHNTEKIQGLIDEILEDIPNRQLYDGKTSVYDLARQSFGGTIRLLEHFRCVPDIIQFSNYLCYNGEIRSLREASASALEPHVVSHHVPGGQAVNKINQKEALEVAALISALCRLPEYEYATLGVISMVGTEQALYIDSILRRRLTVAEYQRRRVLCGNASQFQGDERDVIFLSMVDSPKGKPLTLRSRGDAKKVFNVAASRARDQLWVVHSLEPGRDLKTGDLRLNLISHAENPSSLRDAAPETGDGVTSPFQERLFRELAEAMFRPHLHWPVGDFTVDVMVEGSGGKRVALLCEGDRPEPPEELAEAMERQVILERLGWKFFRLRASEFFRDPDAALKRLFRRLQGAGIDRIGPAGLAGENAPASETAPLKEQVLKRAEMISSRWNEGAEEPPFLRAAKEPAGDGEIVWDDETAADDDGPDESGGE